MQSTYFSFLFLRQLRSCDFCFCFVNMVYGVYINVEKSHLKQFNIRQELLQNMKKIDVFEHSWKMNTFTRHCICIHIYSGGQNS